MQRFLYQSPRAESRLVTVSAYYEAVQLNSGRRGRGRVTVSIISNQDVSVTAQVTRFGRDRSPRRAKATRSLWELSQSSEVLVLQTMREVLLNAQIRRRVG